MVAGGCGSAPSDADATAAGSGETVECRVSGAAEFAPVCAVERVAGERGLLLTIRHPDGGFRRLIATTDGRGVIAADGAERAVVTVAGDRRIEVALGGDAYRLPATVRAVAR